MLSMVSWNEVEQAEPEFAAKVRGLFDAHKHKTIATLRADGSPRISGIEAEFADGELTFGSMPRARKGRTCTAIHGSRCTARPTIHRTIPPDGRGGEGGGRAYAVKALDGADGPEGELFRADLDEVVFTG